MAAIALSAAACLTFAQSPPEIRVGKAAELQEGGKSVTVSVVGQKGKLFEVRFPDGTLKWVAADRLKPQGSNRPAPAAAAPATNPAAPAKADPVPLAPQPEVPPKVQYQPGQHIEFKRGDVWKPGRIIAMLRDIYAVEADEGPKGADKEWMFDDRIRAVGEKKEGPDAKSQLGRDFNKPGNPLDLLDKRNAGGVSAGPRAGGIPAGRGVEGPINIGQSVFVAWRQGARAAKVLEVDGEKYKVRFDGLDPWFDQWIVRPQLRASLFSETTLVEPYKVGTNIEFYFNGWNPGRIEKKEGDLYLVSNDRIKGKEAPEHWTWFLPSQMRRIGQPKSKPDGPNISVLVGEGSVDKALAQAKKELAYVLASDAGKVFYYGEDIAVGDRKFSDGRGWKHTPIPVIDTTKASGTLPALLASAQFAGLSVTAGHTLALYVDPQSPPKPYSFSLSPGADKVTRIATDPGFAVVAMSRNGKVAAVAGLGFDDRNKLQIIVPDETKSERLEAFLPFGADRRYKILEARFTNDDKNLVVISEDRIVSTWIWRESLNQGIKQLSNGLYALDSSGNMLASINGEKLLLIDLVTLDTVGSVTLPLSGASDLAFSPSGKTIFMVSGQSLAVIDAATGTSKLVHLSANAKRLTPLSDTCVALEGVVIVDVERLTTLGTFALAEGAKANVSAGLLVGVLGNTLISQPALSPEFLTKSAALPPRPAILGKGTTVELRVTSAGPRDQIEADIRKVLTDAGITIGASKTVVTLASQPGKTQDVSYGGGGQGEQRARATPEIFAFQVTQDGKLVWQEEFVTGTPPSIVGKGDAQAEIDASKKKEFAEIGKRIKVPSPIIDSTALETLPKLTVTPQGLELK